MLFDEVEAKEVTPGSPRRDGVDGYLRALSGSDRTWEREPPPIPHDGVAMGVEPVI